MQPISSHATTSSSGSGGSGDISGHSRPRKRQIQGVACNECRRRKAKCDGNRPACSACERNDTRCQYETYAGESRTAARSRKTDDLRQENQTLRLENDELRRRLGTDSGFADALASTSATSLSSASSPLDLSPSFHLTAQATIPSWVTPTEYELMMSHPHSYAIRELPDSATLKSLHAKRIRRLLGDVRFAAEPYGGSALHRVPSLDRFPQRSDHALRRELLWQRPSSNSVPVHNDPRLEQVNVGAWCSVAVPNEIAGRLIGFYLEMDHPILGHFDAELFIDDLINLRNEFCSSLLVSSLLLWACHGYSALDSRAVMLKGALFTETIRLWHQERSIDSILTVAAGIFLKISCVCNGDETLGHSIVDDIHQMAHRLNLFGAVRSRSVNAAGDQELTHAQVRAQAHTAWGVFNFITLNVFHYGGPVMRLPPRFVVPGDENTWQMPEYMGAGTFTKLCKLWAIVNEVALVYYAEANGNIRSRTSSAFAEKTYQRLLEWADERGPLIRDWTRDSHHQCYLHMLFHTTILDIFRPFLGLDLPLTTFGDQKHTPESIFTASVHQINYQILIYPVVHPSATFVFWFSAVVQAANAAMTTLQSPASQQMFLLCLLALQDLIPCFPTMSTAVSGLLSIVTRRRDITVGDARQLRDRLRKPTESSNLPANVGGGFVIDLTAALEGPGSVTAGQLAESFESMILNEPAV